MPELMTRVEELIADREIAMHNLRVAQMEVLNRREAVNDCQTLINAEMENSHTQDCINYNAKYEHDTPGECICDA